MLWPGRAILPTPFFWQIVPFAEDILPTTTFCQQKHFANATYCQVDMLLTAAFYQLRMSHNNKTSTNDLSMWTNISERRKKCKVGKWTECESRVHDEIVGESIEIFDAGQLMKSGDRLDMRIRYPNEFCRFIYHLKGLGERSPKLQKFSLGLDSEKSYRWLKLSFFTVF